MTIRELIDTGIIDDNESVIILKGDLNYPTIADKGYWGNIPEELYGKEIWTLGALRKHRAEHFNITTATTEIWLTED